MSFRLPMVSRLLANRKFSKPAPRRQRARHSISLGASSHLLEARRMMSGNEPPAATSPIDFFSFDEDSYSEPIDVGLAFSDPNWDEMTFTIVDGLDAELFTPYLDETGQLMIHGVKDAFGFGALTIRATDPNGEWAETVVSFEILPVNDPPKIESISAALDAGIWAIYGTVSDVDDNVEGFAVEFFGQMGQYFDSVAVEADGTFRACKYAEPWMVGYVSAITEDPHGLQSNVATCFVMV